MNVTERIETRIRKLALYFKLYTDTGIVMDDGTFIVFSSVYARQFSLE